MVEFKVGERVEVVPRGLRGDIIRASEDMPTEFLVRVEEGLARSGWMPLKKPFLLRVWKDEMERIEKPPPDLSILEAVKIHANGIHAEIDAHPEIGQEAQSILHNCVVNLERQAQEALPKNRVEKILGAKTTVRGSTPTPVLELKLENYGYLYIAGDLPFLEGLYFDYYGSRLTLGDDANA